LDRTVRLVALIVATAALAPPAQTQTPALQRIDTGLSRLAATGSFTGVVLVAQRGHVTFQHAYGLANRATGRPNDLETRFNLASVGKSFTAVAVARLVQEHKLRFDDKIGTYLPELPARLRRITVAQLLDHTSGLGDFFGNSLYDALRPTLTSLGSYLPLIGNAPLSAPGRFTYSNSGYLLLGLVVQRVSHRSYYAFLRREIFDRAGMTRSGCFRAAHLPGDAAIGYTGNTPNTPTLPPVGTSAGGCYSTVGDLLEFIDALESHRLLDAELTRTLTTPKVTLNARQRYGFGFGLRYGGPNDAPTIWHNGGSPGVGAEFDINPKLGLTVIVLANRDYSEIRSAVDLVLNALRVP
jgi:CubicO group peptidase (beta-lactamase class C family)